ncbi:hypothetical protein D210916BOD24_34640 [Alteromonas sp. D210916BOD_24]|uniref:hypothetical protein n=1 Tax=Alteromonas sp. D210916BOD_24 TaxID=3157618 RepID=UPI00399CB76E
MDRNRVFKEIGISIKELKILERYCSDSMEPDDHSYSAYCNDSIGSIYTSEESLDSDFSIPSCDY